MLLNVAPFCHIKATVNESSDNAARLEKLIRRQPGDISLRCRLVNALLANGDTAHAERELDYAINMCESPCLLINKAGIALKRKQTVVAAQYCATAVENGLMPDDESLISRIDSLSGGMVSMRLKMMTKTEKSAVNILSGLAQLSIMSGDTATAIACIEETMARGDSTLMSRLYNLKDTTSLDVKGYEVTGIIPFTRNFGKIEINAIVNGLKVKIEVDSTATTSTISGVETLFMIKNKYIRIDEVIDNHIVISRQIDFGNGIILRGLKLYHIRNQETPVILSLKDLLPLGIPRINNKEKCIELMSAPATDTQQNNDRQ